MQHPDGARTIVWMRNGRIRLAIVGSALAIAAGGGAAAGESAGQPAKASPQATQSQGER